MTITKEVKAHDGAPSNLELTGLRNDEGVSVFRMGYRYDFGIDAERNTLELWREDRAGVRTKVWSEQPADGRSDGFKAQIREMLDTRTVEQLRVLGQAPDDDHG